MSDLLQNKSVFFFSHIWSEYIRRPIVSPSGPGAVGAVLQPWPLAVPFTSPANKDDPKAFPHPEMCRSMPAASLLYIQKLT